MNKYYFEYEFSKPFKKFSIIPYLRTEYNKNFDFDTRPMKYELRKVNKFFVIFGLTSKMKF
jgi:hypothetical protein